MNKIIFFCQRLFVSYSVSLMAIIFSIFFGIANSGIVESDIIGIVVTGCLALVMLVMCADGRAEIKNITYYSKVASLNYLFSLLLIVYTVLMKGFHIYFMLAPALLLSLFNIYLCYKMQSNLSNLVVVPELQKLRKLLPDVKHFKIDYDYTFLKPTDAPRYEPRSYKIITTLGSLLFDGNFFYLNGHTYEIANFISGYRSCDINIDTSTPEDATIMQMFCI